MTYPEMVKYVRELQEDAKVGGVTELLPEDAEALGILLDVVSHVPVGRDGVPVYVGMEAWTLEDGEAVRWVVYCIREDNCDLRNEAGSLRARLLCELYSTREAPEKGGAT